MRRPRRLVLVGSVLVDVLLYVPHMPERGGDVLAQGAVVTAGGGYNVLAGASRLGMPVAYAGKVGSGPMGAQVLRDLESADIPILLPPSDDGDTGFDIGLVEPDGERTFVTAPGVESKLTASDLAVIPLVGGDVVYVSGYDLCYPVSGAALADWLPALPQDVLLAFDPGPLVGEIPVRYLYVVLRRVDIINLNQRELAILTGEDALPTAMERLAGLLHEGAWVVVRAGAQGCWLAGPEGHLRHVPGRPVAAVDSTGAGDAHVAALLAALHAGHPLEEAAHRANVAASIAVGRRGPATGPTLEELETLLGEERSR